MKIISITQNKFKIFILIIQCFIILTGILIVIFDQKICLTEKCQQLSKITLRFVNRSKNPCEDFYGHACGNIYSEESHDVYRLAIESLKRQRLRVMHILEQPNFTTEPKSFIMGRQLFKLCQDSDDKPIEVDEVISLVERLGGFPTLQGNQWDESGWSWLKTVLKIRNYGLFNEALLTFTLGFDPNNLMRVIPYIQVPTLTYFPHTIVQCENHCTSYIKSFVDMAADLGADADQALIDAKEVLSLETDIANNIIKFPSITEEYMLKNHIMTLRNLSLTYDFIDWPQFVIGILRADEAALHDLNVVVVNPEFMSTLKRIFETTNKRNLANYVIWSVLNRLPFWPGRKRKRDECYNYMESTLPILVQAMYLGKHHQTEYKSHVFDMIVKIKNEMIRSINNSKWIDDLTKTQAIVKVNNIYHRVGFPKELLNVSLVDEYYKDLSINGSMLDALLHTEQFYWNEYYSWLDYSFDKISGSVISFFFKFIIYIPDAYYIVSDNSVNINFGILQEPIFDKDWPSYVNFGRVGSIIGHEVSHSLDTTGIHYDKNGKATIWWNQLSFNRYKVKAQCFIDQFNAFQLFNGTLHKEFRSDLTVGENIADSTGLGLSFRAYRRYADSLYWPELKLPNLHYTQDQLFFISFAQFYCSGQRHTNYKNISVHAPNKFRVLGSIQNSRYFSSTFNCVIHSKMDPENKCELW